MRPAYVLSLGQLPQSHETMYVHLASDLALKCSLTLSLSGALRLATGRRALVKKRAHCESAEEPAEDDADSAGKATRHTWE